MNLVFRYGAAPVGGKEGEACDSLWKSSRGVLPKPQFLYCSPKTRFGKGGGKRDSKGIRGTVLGARWISSYCMWLTYCLLKTEWKDHLYNIWGQELSNSRVKSSTTMRTHHNWHGLGQSPLLFCLSLISDLPLWWYQLVTFWNQQANVNVWKACFQVY